MPLSFLSFLSFFFLSLFFYVVTFACIRAVIEAPQKKRRPCVCVCVCGSLGGSARAGVSAQMMHRGQTLVLSPF